MCRWTRDVSTSRFEARLTMSDRLYMGSQMGVGVGSIVGRRGLRYVATNRARGVSRVRSKCLSKTYEQARNREAHVSNAASTPLPPCSLCQIRPSHASSPLTHQAL